MNGRRGTHESTRRRVVGHGSASAGIKRRVTSSPASRASDPLAIEFAPTGYYKAPPRDETRAAFRVLDPDTEIGPEVAEHVLDAADRACLALELPSIEVLLTAPCAPDHPAAIECTATQLAAWGLHWRRAPGQIFINALGRTPDELERTIVHECRHSWQHLHGYGDTHSTNDLERDAHRFDRAWMAARG